jgi:hypothetical protein
MKPLMMKPISLICAALLLAVILPVLPQQVSKTCLTAEAQTRRRRPARPTYTDTRVIPLGTNLRLRLNRGLSSKDSRVGDRFAADVVGSSRYEGAVVAGHVSSIRKSGRVEGRTSMALSFDSIQLRDGRKATMHGQLIRLYDGDSSTKVDEEGNAQSGGRGKQTLKRSGIGAVAGAVVGGLIGGGKGVAAGLIIGGAAGAGSIAIQGSKELRLEPGAEMLVRVTRR